MATSALRDLPMEARNARRANIGQGPYVRPDTSGQDLTGELLNAGSIAMSPVPVVGDILGLAADFRMYQTDPASRTMGNYGMTLAGLLPFVPGAAAVRSAKVMEEAASRGLDMSQGARMQRADEYGGVQNWYRGSPVDEGEELSRKFLGENTSAQSAKKGFFFSTNPETASSAGYATVPFEITDDFVTSKYKNFQGMIDAAKPEISNNFKTSFDKLYSTDYSLKNDQEEILVNTLKDLAYDVPDDYYTNKNITRAVSLLSSNDVSGELKNIIYEAMPEVKRVFDVQKDINMVTDNIKASDKFAPAWAKGGGLDDGSDITTAFNNFELGANVGKYKLNMSNPYIYDMGGSGYREQSYNDIIKEALSGGHDSVIIKNTFDGGKELTDIGVIFEPNQARSVNAAFDPTKRNSANLMAGVAGGTVALSALRNINKDEQPSK